MAYKSILTIVTGPDLGAEALDTALGVTNAQGAHLDVMCLGVDRVQVGFYHAGANAVLMQETLAQAQADAEEALTAVKARLTAETVPWSADSVALQTAAMPHVIGRRARFCDLVVLPKPYGPARSIDHEAMAEAALFDSNTPVVFTPAGSDFTAMPKRVVVGWNQSAEALRAIRAALPMLQQADQVSVAIIDPPRHGPDRSDPGGLLAQMLGRHGVRAEISVLAKTLPRVSDVLLRHAGDFDADMIVMGAYGHSRFREAILGGVTRDMLGEAEVPVLMAH
ncbi:universal stress protein [Actibacterium mucosum KCTC 23349]|uniref:Universal stress protein n=1 Tax=Actibacterium mucosum KCTC 23349 TaxID=1454373 RepID=A0A037ZH84_9RHOB|nr:universal stress protein [Actibacterium mucosum]KAJ54887.1 universal stress protein [Actibacterium mucosum KCTC 23349]